MHYISRHNPKPSPKLQAELNRFATYRQYQSQMGTTNLVKVTCRVCNQVQDPCWLTLKALKYRGRDGRCWNC